MFGKVLYDGGVDGERYKNVLGFFYGEEDYNALRSYVVEYISLDKAKIAYQNRSLKLDLFSERYFVKTIIQYPYKENAYCHACILN